MSNERATVTDAGNVNQHGATAPGSLAAPLRNGVALRNRDHRRVELRGVVAEDAFAVVTLVQAVALTAARVAAFDVAAKVFQRRE